jgi:hypothetical protein
MLGWSRNSGPSGISFIQKFWAGPEILGKVDFIHTEILGWSRNSGPSGFHSYRKSGLVQKSLTTWISFIQKFWAFPEILDHVNFIHTEILGWWISFIQKFWTKWISFIQKFWSSPEILDQVDFIQTEILGWSRNSGPNGIHSNRNSGLVQKFWTRCISLFLQKIWAGPEIHEDEKHSNIYKYHNGLAFYALN